MENVKRGESLTIADYSSLDTIYEENKDFFTRITETMLEVKKGNIIEGIHNITGEHNFDVLLYNGKKYSSLQLMSLLAGNITRIYVGIKIGYIDINWEMTKVQNIYQLVDVSDLTTLSHIFIFETKEGLKIRETKARGEGEYLNYRITL